METISKDEIHEALRWFSDSVQLAEVELVERFPQLKETGALNERANHVRALLLEAIEALRPPRSLAFGALESRAYDVLTLRYVENMTLGQMADELLLSQRQIQRDLAQAEEKLARMLATWANERHDHLREASRDSLSDELRTLTSQPAQVQLAEVLESATNLLRRLAARLSVRLEWLTAAPTANVVTDRAVLKQVLVQLLSVAIHGAAGGAVSLSVNEDEETVAVSIRFNAEQRSWQSDRLSDAQRIAASQGIGCQLDLGELGAVELSLRFRSGRPVAVLVVEDNNDAVDLYHRYLGTGNWQLHRLPDPRLTYEVARQNRPDVIMLDIMMSRVDGWSVLESLSQHADTADIPVLVCSVVNDPELAAALGARSYLKKPFSQGQLVVALRQCLSSRRPAAPPGPAPRR